MKVVGLLLCVVLCGCGGKGTLTGTVSYKGAPVAMGQVIVVAQDGGMRVGPIQPDGKYEVRDVPTGTAKIAVESPDPRGGSPVVPGEGVTVKAVPQGWQALPEKYGSIVTSGLTVDVKAGVNTHNVPLE